MGLTKQYLRYVPASKFNIISNSKCNVKFAQRTEYDSWCVATGGAEDALIWDARLSKKLIILEGDEFEAVFIDTCFETKHIAVGYNDGSVSVFSYISGENICTFSGHRSPVTALAFAEDGHCIATGSKDTDVVVWDVVAEAGLFRLTGHNAPITQVQFMRTRKIVISSSKDTFVKFWDLSNGHCFKTLTGHVTEVWAFCITKDDEFLVTGSNDSELRVWQLKENPNYGKSTYDGGDLSIDYGSPIVCEKAGSILRQGLGRVMGLVIDRTGSILCCYGNEKTLETFHFVSPDEALRRYNKKLKKLNKKMKAGEESLAEEMTPTSLRFRVSRMAAVKTLSKVGSVDVVFGNGIVKTVVSTKDNSFEIYSLKVDEKEWTSEKRIWTMGHRTEVRALVFSSDSTAIASAAHDSIKVWRHDVCLRTAEADGAQTIAFAAGDRHVLAGTKSGKLLVVDVAAGDVIETIEAHEKELNQVIMTPNKLGAITCSSDCTVKFWNVELLKEHVNGITLVHTRTLKVDDAVLGVRITPDSNLIAVALLDSTVKIFFADSLKFFLSLYGHKLPVTCLDVSDDSTLIATGSNDRNVKIWGLDYGDCHRSIFAHDDAVTALVFVPRTHHFVTCGKDGRIKRWDADTFERVQTLAGHRGEALALAVSADAQWLASCGHDRLVRTYERSMEPLVLEDEREVEREEEEEKTLATGADSVVFGRETMKLASKKTVSAEKGAELLLECLDLLRDYSKSVIEAKRTNSPAPPIPPLMSMYGATSATDYLLIIMRKIRGCDLEESLMLLPLSSVAELLQDIVQLLRKTNRETETVARILVFVLRAHHRPLVSSKNLYGVVRELQTLSIDRLTQLKDMVGCNLQGLGFVQRLKEAEGVQLFREALYEKKKANKKNKYILKV